MLNPFLPIDFHRISVGNDDRTQRTTDFLVSPGWASTDRNLATCFHHQRCNPADYAKWNGGPQELVRTLMVTGTAVTMNFTATSATVHTTCKTGWFQPVCLSESQKVTLTVVACTYRVRLTQSITQGMHGCIQWLYMFKGKHNLCYFCL